MKYQNQGLRKITKHTRLTINIELSGISGSSIGDIVRLAGVVARMGQSGCGDDQTAVAAQNHIRVLPHLLSVLQPNQLQIHSSHFLYFIYFVCVCVNLPQYTALSSF